MTNEKKPRSGAAEKENKIQTGFRATESLNDEIEAAAKEYNISKNALMTIAMRIGLNTLKGVNQVHFPQE